MNENQIDLIENQNQIVWFQGHEIPKKGKQWV